MTEFEEELTMSWLEMCLQIQFLVKLQHLLRLVVGIIDAAESRQLPALRQPLALRMEEDPYLCIVTASETNEQLRLKLNLQKYILW